MIENIGNKNYKNRGMLLENIINKTIWYYKNNDVAFFEKKDLNVKFNSVKFEKNKKMLLNSFISSKSTVDYYGIYKGKYVTFEAKSTNESVFYFSNIKEHQHKHLKMIKKFGGISFYIILFKKELKIFLIDVEKIKYEEEKSISIKEVENLGYEIKIIFPGIIDFLIFIDKLK